MKDGNEALFLALMVFSKIIFYSLIVSQSSHKPDHKKRGKSYRLKNHKIDPVHLYPPTL